MPMTTTVAAKWAHLLHDFEPTASPVQLYSKFPNSAYLLAAIASLLALKL